MSSLEGKLAQHRDGGGKARRTYASLLAARGYRVADPSAPVLLAICPMDTPSYWRHVGAGRWNSPGAEYEKEET